MKPVHSCVYICILYCVYMIYVIDSFDIFVSSPCYPLNCINMSLKPKVSKAQIIVLKQTKRIKDKHNYKNYKKIKRVSLWFSVEKLCTISVLTNHSTGEKKYRLLFSNKYNYGNFACPWCLNVFQKCKCSNSLSTFVQKRGEESRRQNN